MEDMADADYAHPKRVCKDFDIKTLGKYHDLYFESNASFENFRNMRLKI